MQLGESGSDHMSFDNNHEDELWQENKCILCQTKHLSIESFRTHLINNKIHREKLKIYEFFADFTMYTLTEGLKPQSIDLIQQTEGLIGANYVSEFRTENQDLCFWACQVCYVTGTLPVKLIEHLKSHTHCMNYIISYHQNKMPKNRGPKEIFAAVSKITKELASLEKNNQVPDVMMLLATDPAQVLSNLGILQQPQSQVSTPVSEKKPTLTIFSDGTGRDQKIDAQSSPDRCQSVEMQIESNEALTPSTNEPEKSQTISEEDKNITSTLTAICKDESTNQQTGIEMKLENKEKEEVLASKKGEPITDAHDVPPLVIIDDEEDVDNKKGNNPTTTKETNVNPDSASIDPYKFESDVLTPGALTLYNDAQDYIIWCQSCWVCIVLDKRMQEPLASWRQHCSDPKHLSKTIFRQRKNFDANNFINTPPRIDLSNEKSEYAFDKIEIKGQQRILFKNYIGLHYIFEYHSEIDRTVSYICHLCCQEIPGNYQALVWHLATEAHVVQFMHKDFTPQIRIWGNRELTSAPKRRELIIKCLKEKAAEAAAKGNPDPNRGNIIVYDECVARAMKKRIINPNVDQPVLMGLYMKLLDSGCERIQPNEAKRPLNMQIGICSIPIVGTNHVFEVNCPQVPSWRGYICKMCVYLDNERKFINHLKGEDHIMEFLMRYSPPHYQSLLGLKSKSMNAFKLQQHNFCNAVLMTTHALRFITQRLLYRVDVRELARAFPLNVPDDNMIMLPSLMRTALENPNSIVGPQLSITRYDPNAPVIDPQQTQMDDSFQSPDKSHVEQACNNSARVRPSRFDNSELQNSKRHRSRSSSRDRDTRPTPSHYKHSRSNFNDRSRHDYHSQSRSPKNSPSEHYNHHDRPAFKSRFDGTAMNESSTTNEIDLAVHQQIMMLAQQQHQLQQQQQELYPPSSASISQYSSGAPRMPQYEPPTSTMLDHREQSRACTATSNADADEEALMTRLVEQVSRPNANAYNIARSLTLREPEPEMLALIQKLINEQRAKLEKQQQRESIMGRMRQHLATQQPQTSAKSGSSDLNRLLDNLQSISSQGGNWEQTTSKNSSKEIFNTLINSVSNKSNRTISRAQNPPKSKNTNTSTSRRSTYPKQWKR